MPFDQMESRGCEQLVFCHDPNTQLRAIIAIHNTTLGPALGGLRFWPYASVADAVEDAVRLAQGMTYKAALAGLPLGGGKAVILADSLWREPSPALLRAFGGFVQRLQGLYTTAADLGTTEAHLQVIHTVTPYVAAISHAAGEPGDPGVFTAYGVYQGIQEALEYLGYPSVQGRRIAIQGAGATASHLCELLAAAGASLYIADIRPERAQQVAARYGAEVVAPEQIHQVPCDVFSPCAVGSVLNDITIPQLRCSIVAGAANNPLYARHHHQLLAARDILYIPDYVINAGGLIFAAESLGKRRDPRERIRGIRTTLRELLLTARVESLSPLDVADRWVQERLQKGVQTTAR